MKLTGWLIYRRNDAKRNASYINWFIHEAKKRDITLDLIYRDELIIGIKNQRKVVLYKNRNIPFPDFAVIRTIEPMLQLHFEACNVRVFNSYEVSLICNDKAYTYHEINKLNIPMVDTFYYTADKHFKNLPLDFPFVAKLAKGRSGEEVFFIQNEAEWERCIQDYPKNNWVIQDSSVQMGEDIRVFVLGKNIIGAVKRKNKHDFRSNYTLGGSASWYTLQENDKKIVQKIVDYFHFDFVGIDFLVGLNGQLLFNEIEDVVGSRTLSLVSDINVLEKYVTHIINEMTKR